MFIVTSFLSIAQTLQDRLGVRGRLGSKPYGGLGLSYAGSSAIRAKPMKSNSAANRGHSRFRLERDPDAMQSSPPVSGDEADDPDADRADEDLDAPRGLSDDTSFIDRGFNRTKFTNRLDTEFITNSNDAHDEDKVADASAVFGVELAVRSHGYFSRAFLMSAFPVLWFFCPYGYCSEYFTICYSTSTSVSILLSRWRRLLFGYDV